MLTQLPKVQLFTFLCLLFSGYLHAQTTVVSNCNPNGWFKNATSGSTVVFYPTGPGTPTMPFGSAQFSVGSGTGQGCKMMNNSFAGTPLSQVSTLNYFSYIQDFGSGALQGEGIYMILTVDYNADGSADDTLYYQPLYQDLFLTLTYGQWQFWDGLVGKWWSKHGIAASSPGSGVKPLADFISLYPNSKMREFGLAAGYVTGSWSFFLANADAFKIKAGSNPLMVYNFESQNDADNDGICDSEDYCPSVPGIGDAYYKDQDNDGYGNKDSSVIMCMQPAGYVLNSTDCNDFNPNIHPGAVEVCNNIDDNCDGIIDDGPAINANAGFDQSIFFAGPGVVVPGYATCATLTASASGGTGTLTYSWSNGATSQTISVCPAVSTTYIVTVTDRNGCKATDDIIINVTDATCAGPGNNIHDYILVCKDLKEKCIKPKDLSRYIADGYTFGPCYNGRGGGGSFAQIIPDGNQSSGKFGLDLSRMECQWVKVLITRNDNVVDERKVRAGVKDLIENFNLSDKSTGVYNIKIIAEEKVFNSKILVYPR